MIDARIAGLLLAAGAGRRYGQAKVLADEGRGSWGPRTAQLLRDAGCAPVLVVLGAQAEQARPLFTGTDVQLLWNPDWASGMAGSLKVGMDGLHELPPAVQAVLLMLVDLPGMTVDAMARVIAAGRENVLADAVVQAAFHGVPGHPVLLGRRHWAAAAESAHGDAGARKYLDAHRSLLVEVADVADGADRDTPTRQSDPSDADIQAGTTMDTTPGTA